MQRTASMRIRQWDLAKLLNMKLFVQSAVLLLAVALNNAQIVKVSSTIIQNGTTLYSVFRSEEADEMVVIKSVNPTEKAYSMMLADKPRWVQLQAVDPTPDINVIGEDQVRLYFTAYDTLRKRSQIGVAVNYRLSTDDSFSYYMPLGDPLDLPGNGYGLAGPSLIQGPEGTNPVLFFANGTNVWSASLDQGLFYNGQSTLLSPSLAWEGGAMHSPRALEHNGVYYLLYTTADGVTIGALRSENHEGPYEKKPEPIGVTRDRSVNIRNIHKDDINWSEDGWPYL